MIFFHVNVRCFLSVVWKRSSKYSNFSFISFNCRCIFRVNELWLCVMACYFLNSHCNFVKEVLLNFESSAMRCSLRVVVVVLFELWQWSGLIAPVTMWYCSSVRSSFMTTESLKLMFCIFKGCICVLSSFIFDGLIELSCISFSWFSGSNAFASSSLLFVFFEVPTGGVFSSWYLLLGTDCVLVFFISFNIFSTFSFISFLRSDISLFVFSVILWVHTCISSSFWEPFADAFSPSLTELTFSKLLEFQ